MKDFNSWWISLGLVPPIAGGALIGLAVAMLLLANGRVAGISGIVGALLRPVRGDVAWRVLFVLGMVLAPAVAGLWTLVPTPEIEAGFAVVALAGLLVGVGTRYASGCTSGHGVCGVSRLSPRSLVATAVFMASGIATVFVVRHLLFGWRF